jgi:hypothetical protein
MGVVVIPLVKTSVACGQLDVLDHGTWARFAPLSGVAVQVTCHPQAARGSARRGVSPPGRQAAEERFKAG